MNRPSTSIIQSHLTNISMLDKDFKKILEYISDLYEDRYNVNELIPKLSEYILQNKEFLEGLLRINPYFYRALPDKNKLDVKLLRTYELSTGSCITEYIHLFDKNGLLDQLIGVIYRMDMRYYCEYLKSNNPERFKDEKFLKRFLSYDRYDFIYEFIPEDHTISKDLAEIILKSNCVDYLPEKFLGDIAFTKMLSCIFFSGGGVVETTYNCNTKIREIIFRRKNSPKCFLSHQTNEFKVNVLMEVIHELGMTEMFSKLSFFLQLQIKAFLFSATKLTNNPIALLCLEMIFTNVILIESKMENIHTLAKWEKYYF